MIIYILLIVLFICIIYRYIVNTKKIQTEIEIMNRDSYFRNKDKIDLNKAINDAYLEFKKDPPQ